MLQPVMSIVVLAVTFLPFPGIRPSVSLRPHIVQNGADFIIRPFNPIPAAATNVAFTPDGNAYFVDAPNEVARVSPDGTLTRIPVPRADYGAHDFGSIPATAPFIYARGRLWMSADASGVVSVNPDGSGRHWYPLGGAATVFGGLTIGPDDAIYATAFLYDQSTGVSKNSVFRIDRRDTVTSVSIPVAGNGPAVFGSDGLLYFGYLDYPNTSGVARLERDGTTTEFPINHAVNGVHDVVGLVLDHGSIYYEEQWGDSSFGRLTPNGSIVNIPLPGSFAFNLAVDKGGNIWTVVTTPSSAQQLYQYNIYTGHFNGPLAASSFDAVYAGPFVGPDDNVYMLLAPSISAFFEPAALGVLVRHVQTLEPAAVSVMSGKASAFSILETHFNGPWTAQSLNPSIAAVSPGVSPNGTFTVRENGRGSTSIAVRDRLGNVSYESVTAQ